MTKKKQKTSDDRDEVNNSFLLFINSNMSPHWLLFILFHYYIIKGEDEKISNQEKIEQKLRTEQEEGQHQMTENLLNSIKENPEMWEADRLLYLRNFCSYARRHLPPCPGDDTVELPVH